MIETNNDEVNVGEGCLIILIVMTTIAALMVIF